MTKTAMQMIVAAKAQVGAVSPVDASAQLRSGKAVLLDVREAEEWQHGHLDGSVPAPQGLGRVLRRPDESRRSQQGSRSPPGG